MVNKNEAMTTVGNSVGKPPTYNDDDDGDGDNREWWNDDVRVKFMKWMQKKSQCYKKCVHFILDFILNAENNPYNAHGKGPSLAFDASNISYGGGYGRITLHWGADWNEGNFEETVIENIKQTLLRNCDVWKAIDIRQEDAWHALDNSEFFKNVILLILSSHLYADYVLKPEIKLDTYEYLRNNKRLQSDLMRNFIMRYNDRYKTNYTPNDFKMQPTNNVSAYYRSNFDNGIFLVVGEQVFAFDMLKLSKDYLRFT